MKNIFYIGVVSLLLASCSLFSSTPESVLKGQQAVYKSVVSGQEFTSKIITEYQIRCQKLMTYHANYVFGQKLKEIHETEYESWQPSKEDLIKQAERARDAELEKAFRGLDRRIQKLREELTKRNSPTLKLVGSVYNYLSTDPIEIDALDFWINRLEGLDKQKNGQTSNK